MSLSYNIWLDGAPVLQAGDSSNFSVWLDGSPLLHSSVAPPDELIGTFCGVSCFSGTLTGTGALSGSFCGFSCFIENLNLIKGGEFDAWLDGAPVILAGNSMDFAVWLDGTVLIHPLINQPSPTGSTSGNFCGDSCLTGTLTGTGDLAGAFCGDSCFVGTATGPTIPGNTDGVFCGVSCFTAVLTGTGALSGSFCSTSCFGQQLWFAKRVSAKQEQLRNGFRRIGAGQPRMRASSF